MIAGNSLAFSHPEPDDSMNELHSVLLSSFEEASVQLSQQTTVFLHKGKASKMASIEIEKVKGFQSDQNPFRSYRQEKGRGKKERKEEKAH